MTMPGKLNEDPQLTSKAGQILDLATELVDDLELSRLPATGLVLKTMRLARLTGDQKVQEWLGYELVGYSDTPVGVEFMTLTGRWINYEAKLGYWFPVAAIEGKLEAARLLLGSMRTPDIQYAPSSSSQYDYTSAGAASFAQQMQQVTNSMTGSRGTIETMTAIRAKVVAVMHTFAVNVYHERLFSGLSETVFERYRARVDALIAETAGDVLAKFPSVEERLVDNNPEAISQALTTCRRIMDSFADSVFPPREGTKKVDGNDASMGANNHKNRLNAHIEENVASSSRRIRLRQTLKNLYDRLSTGVHSEVTGEEAQSLFLQTYLLLGEIATLGEKPSVPSRDSLIH